MDKQANQLSLRSKKAYHRLGDDVMSLAAQGRMTLELLQDISHHLMRFAACKAVETAYTERGRIFHSDARDGETPAFFCNTMPADDSSMETLLSVLKIHPVKPNEKTAVDTVSSVIALHAEETSGVAYQSVLRLPLLVAGELRGLILLGYASPISLSAQTLESLENLCRSLALALSHNQSQFEVRERVKELACMYGIANLAARKYKNISTLFEKIVMLLPAAWLYPDITQACIVFDGKPHATEGFLRGDFLQQADIVVNDAIRGSVEIVYLESRPKLDEGPFLAEERHLIDSVARELALIIQRREAEKEQQRLSEQLQHAERLATIGQLAAGVAHELNEPLTGILGFAELLNELEGLPQQAFSDIERIESAALHAREIVRKLLLFARQVPTKSEKVNVNTIITDVISFFRTRLAKASVKAETNLASELKKISADPAQIRQIIINLLVNAIHAMPNGGRLSLKTRNAEKHIRLEIADTGVGMSKEVLSKIYMPFFTTKDVNEGTGLGLSVVHGIIKAHKGRIEVQSMPERGTTFIIHLPIERERDDE